MLVEAKKRGFFGGEYRNVGDQFDCPTDKQFSKTWMIKITKKSKKVTKKKGPTKIPSLEIPDLIAKEEAKEKEALKKAKK